MAIDVLERAAPIAIVNDPALDEIVAEARSEFMADKPFDRLDATIMTPDADGIWRRGSYNPEAVAYPASCVKLPYMVAAMRWCRENHRSCAYLDHCVRPMIARSDNTQTGIVIDTITGAPNRMDIVRNSTEWDEWVRQRRYAQHYLESHGLLSNQIVMHKTYPTNSGESPVGIEKTARELLGMNRMQPQASASLMLRIVKGQIEPQARNYMMSLLRHERWTEHNQFGTGMPPGTVCYNKSGVAYDTLEDIAYAVLPNGKEFILAAFSNAYVEPYISDPSPYDGFILGGFCELLIEKSGLNEGNPPKLIVNVWSPGFSSTGGWKASSAHDAHQGAYMSKNGKNRCSARAVWNLDVPETGKYEICVWHPQAHNHAKDAQFTVCHSGGKSDIFVNQRVAGGMWFRLGNFRFRKGEGRVELSNSVSESQCIVAAGAVKATKWPSKR